MKVKLFVFSIIILLCFNLNASDHGIYLLTNKAVKANLDTISLTIVDNLENEGYQVIYNNYVKSPDYVREDASEHCGFRAKILVVKKKEYTKMLTSYGSKYLVAGFLRIGIYETPEGLNINIVDPGTINRIVFNDLYENDEVNKYNEVIAKTRYYRSKIISILHKIDSGEKLEQAMEPIRDDEDLAESSKDMFMMVGPLTLFTDEDQFPMIYSVTNTEGFDGLKKLKNEFTTNLRSFVPTDDDVEYRWFQNENDLKWEVICELESPKKDAILIGITRPRTEAVSFNIAGSSREDESNMCPGIDHASAYPIEVLFIQEGNKLNVYTQREMHRMDMYFWDAGMAAFMDHMSMPGILDESIKKALLGNKFLEE